MTDRLYYQDSYWTDFSAELIELREVGNKRAAILDRTAFYPTSGGQPHDTGLLSSVRTYEVAEDESGTILHFIEAELPLGTIRGRVDWARRFDFMQQHSGQHILSQAFIQTAGAATLSFHLGLEICTIDLALEQPSEEIMEKAEDTASGIVFENRPVRILEVDRSGLAALGIRKDTQREGQIRVIEVEGFDRSACGGTHVRSSGEVGLIAILGYERYKGGTRVEFACGRRALKTLRKDHEVLKSLGRLYSGHPYELPKLTGKLMEERSELARENARLVERLLEFEADTMVREVQPMAGMRLVQARYTGRSIENVKLLAQKIAAHSATAAILVLSGETAQIVVSKSGDLEIHCGAAIKQAAARFGGKGGGRAELAQAGGIPAAAIEPWIHELASAMALK